MRAFAAIFAVLWFASSGFAAEVEYPDPNRIGTRAIVDIYTTRVSDDQAMQFDARYDPKEINAEIKKARAAFWALYPDKPGVREAAAKLDGVLVLKDAQIVRDMIERRLYTDAFNQIPAIWAPKFFPPSPSKEFDGGVPTIASGSFNEWATIVMGRLPANPLDLVGQSRRELIAQGLKNSTEQMIVHLEVRDYAEFYRAGRPGDYFPTGRSFVWFAFLINADHVDLPPDGRIRMAESIAALRALYSEEAIEKVGDTLRKSKLGPSLEALDYEQLGIPRDDRNAQDAILFLLNRNAPPRAFAIGALRTRGQYLSDALIDGAARYTAMLKTHDPAKVELAVMEIQQMPLDIKTGLITEGELAGATWEEALFIRLPLAEDPGLANIAARRQKKIDDELKRQQDKQDALDKILYARAADASEAQYKNIREAYALAKTIDPRTQGYTDLAGDVLKVAGYWDLHAKNPTVEGSGWHAWDIVQKMSRRKPKEEGDRFAQLLGFTKHHAASQAKYLVPLEQVQAEWIKEGKIAPDDALDLSATPSRTRLQAELARAQAILDGSLKTLETSQVAKDDARFLRQIELQKRWVKHRQQMLDDYLRDGPYALFVTDEDGPTAEEALDAFVLLREISASYEPIWLEWMNEVRRDAGLKPIKRDPIMAVAAEAAAGLWNSYLLTGDKQYLDAMWVAMNEATFRDQDGQFFYSEIRATFRLPAGIEVLPPPPAPVQNLRVATGQMAAAEAFDFRTPIEIAGLLLELRIKQNQLAFRDRDLAAKFEAMDQIIEKIAEMDQAIGRPPRLTTYASRVDHDADTAVADSTQPGPQTAPSPTRDLEAGIEPVPEPAADPGTTDYDGWIEAIRLAEEADAAALAAHNAEREDVGLEPLTAFTECRDWVNLAAGFWDRFARTGEADDYNLAHRSLSRCPWPDRQAKSKIREVLPFVYEPLSQLEQIKRTPLAEVQARRLAEEDMAEAERLPLLASPERYALLDDVVDAADKLRRTELRVGKQKQRSNQRESTLKRLDEQVSDAGDDYEAALNALKAYDAEAR